MRGLSATSLSSASSAAQTPINNAPAPIAAPSAIDDFASAEERQRRVSYAGVGSSFLSNDDPWGPPSAGTGVRTTRASSEDQLLASSTSLLSAASSSSTTTLNSRTSQGSAPASIFAQAPAPPSAPLQSPTSLDTPTPAASQTTPGANGSTLHLGDLDIWMDEPYVRECCARMGWDGVVGIKMIRGNSPTSGYCFLTFASPAHAAAVLAKFNASPPTLMPRSSRTFKLNWGTGYPGVQPRWEGEYSVFVGDLGRDVGEAELVNLFTPLFPSTKSAKIMYDPTTNLSRGYGFVRFAEEGDMQRALSLGLGANNGSGLSLHGRTLRISEASGPGGERERERSRTRSDGGVALGGGAASELFSPTLGMGAGAAGGGGYPVAFTPLSPLSPSGFGGGGSNPLSPRLGGFGSPSLGSSTSGRGGIQLGAPPNRDAGQPHTTDPNNTTVFVGGLPACISEETLKSFFHHFGEITYCKIPTGKGCGFVQFVRRQDAELAITKMNDFPIHGKSRIRLSWGRSQGDKQVEHVRKLAQALGVQFESVWKMVQRGVAGDNRGERLENLGVGRTELGAVANAAGLTEAEVLDLVGGRERDATGGSNVSGGIGGVGEYYPRSALASPTSPTFPSDGLHLHHANGGGPYSRVSPSTFSAFSSSPPLPLSPPPSAGPGFSHHPYAPHSPYTSIRPESYLVHSPTSPYERVDFAEGGVPVGSTGRVGGRYQSHQHQGGGGGAGGYGLHQSQTQYTRFAPELAHPQPQQHHHLNQYQPHHYESHPPLHASLTSHALALSQSQQPHPAGFPLSSSTSHVRGQSHSPSKEHQRPTTYSMASLDESFNNLGFSSPPPSVNNANARSHFLSSPSPDWGASPIDRARGGAAVGGGGYMSPGLEDHHSAGARWGTTWGARDVQA
ncbi:mRNA binding post-transcriptional regulator (Csx1) [Pseudohyphozyma bogoriensis]|nr:mRNA binding post-transcriptional regulator (Csx1) [Pseudohyphozyma bogoriensis]